MSYFVLTIGKEGSSLIEIDGSGGSQVVAFSTNGGHLVSGSFGVGVWRVYDGKQMARMEMFGSSCVCLAVSKDGRWIAALLKWLMVNVGGGTDFDRLIVWDAKTFEQVLTIKEERFVRSAPILAQLSLSAVRAA